MQVATFRSDGSYVGGRWPGSVVASTPREDAERRDFTVNGMFFDPLGDRGVIDLSALAWNLKAWYGLLMPNRQRGLELLGMEFRRFLHLIVLLPAQIVRSGRRIIYRIMGYNSWLKDFFASWENLRRMAPA